MNADTKPLQIAIIGAGHNGLVCAFYLASAGHEVTLFEARSKTGGLCVTEELFTGFRVSTVASYYGMLREEIARDLELETWGLQTYLADPIEIVLLPDGQYSYTPREGGGSRYRINGLTDADVQGWSAFWGDIARAAAVLSPFYMRPPVGQKELQEALRAAGLPTIADGLFERSLLDLLGEYVENPAFKAAASTCTPGFSNLPGTIFGCIHHGTAVTAGQPGAWGFVKGGMGAITEAMTQAALAAGAQIMLDCPIEKALTKNGRATGILTESGALMEFDCVISNADPWQTFGRLLDGESLAAGTGAQLRERLQTEVPTVSAGKVHLALSRLPRFAVLDELQHNYQGVIVVAPPLESIIEDAKRVHAGAMPSQLMMTMCFPSTMDDTIAPVGKHLLTVDIHYLPGAGDISAEALVEKVLTDLSAHASDIRECVVEAAAVGPTELRNQFRLSGASCWHLPMAPQFLADKRNFSGASGHRTQIPALYVCGAGTYPAGNVNGAPGYNCAQQILADDAAGKIKTKQEFSYVVK